MAKATVETDKKVEFPICKLAKKMSTLYIIKARKEKKFSAFNEADKKDFGRYLDLRFQLFINEETEPKDKATRKEWYDLAVAMNPYFNKRVFGYVCRIAETLEKIPKIDSEETAKKVFKEYKMSHQKTNKAKKYAEERTKEVVKKQPSGDVEKECGIVGDAICGTATAIADFFCWL